MKIFLKLSGLILLMFVGCTFDSEIDELNAPALNKSKDQISLQTSEPKTVTVPIKADFYSLPDTILPGVGCTPTQANIIMKGWRMDRWKCQSYRFGQFERKSLGNDQLFL